MTGAVTLSNTDISGLGTMAVETATNYLTTATASATYFTIASAANKADLASPSLTGTPLSTTAAVDTNTTQIATTAYVVAQAASATPLVNGTAAVGTSLRYARADHVHGTDTTRAPLASPTFTGTVTIPVGASISGFAPLASPTFTGTPTLPTGTIATTQTAGNSTTAVATTAFVTTADNLKANLASPTFTGTPLSTTASAGTNTTQIATTAFVRADNNVKAWVNFNGTGTPAIRGSLNVTSITDLGVGNWQVNFTTAMTDVNYSAVCSSRHSAGVTYLTTTTPDVYATGSVTLITANPGAGAGTLFDSNILNVAILR
jgi:hypothetical protein